VAKSLFPLSAFPACKNCLNGRISPSGDRILCIRNGVVGPDYSCKKYRYNPLNRVPMRMPNLPAFDKEDFKL